VPIRVCWDDRTGTAGGQSAGTLTGMGERLDGTFTDALAQAEAATTAARGADGQRRAAEIERDASIEQAQEATCDRGTAERARDAAIRLRKAAEGECNTAL
jgi:hypothetical protein